MAVSANGYSANDRSVIASYDLPGGRVALRKGDVSVVLLWCANRWHTTVEPLVWPGVWGYAERTIRGSDTVLSNHASGTAIDCNAPQHPLATAPTANFTPAELVAVRAIVTACRGVIRWGGDYTGRKDGMHLEVNADAAAVRAVADDIRAGRLGTPTPRPAPPTPGGDWFDMATEADLRRVIAETILQAPLADYYTANDKDRMALSDCLAWGTTHAAHARDAAREALAKATTLESKVDALLARMVSGTTTGPGALSDADVERIAAALVKRSRSPLA